MTYDGKGFLKFGIISAIQEQQEKIELLEKENQNKNKKIIEIETRFLELEQKLKFFLTISFNIFLK